MTDTTPPISFTEDGRVSDMQVKRCVEGLREFSAKLEGGPAAVTFDSAELLERQSRRITELEKQSANRPAQPSEGR